MLAVYTPVRNAAAWAQELVPVPGVRHVVLDSGSTDGTPEILAAKGLVVERAASPRGRLENWAACLEHFLASDATWLKWWFAGDRLEPAVPGLVEAAAARLPDLRLVVGDFTLVAPDGVRTPKHSLPETALVWPAESLRRFVVHGHWTGGFLAWAYHREALAGYRLGCLPYVADMQLHLDLLARYPVLNVHAEFGQVILANRAFESAHGTGASAKAQDLALRYQALDLLAAAEPDATDLPALAEHLRRFAAGLW